METIHIEIPPLIEKLELDIPLTSDERLFLKMLCIEAYLGADEFNAAMEQAYLTTPRH